MKLRPIYFNIFKMTIPHRQQSNKTVPKLFTAVLWDIHALTYQK